MAEKLQQPEVWLRGPLEDLPVLLQPAAFALMQTNEELPFWLKNFPKEKLWVKPAGRASVGFHLKHLSGVLDRMLTYAKEEPLSSEQFAYLKAEEAIETDLSVEQLINVFTAKVEEALTYFKTLEEHQLTEIRSVGRKKLPSTLIGLIFHAAEHSQRHLGQLIATVSFVKTL